MRGSEDPLSVREWPQIDEAARHLGLSRQTLWRARTSGHLPPRYYFSRPRKGRGGPARVYHYDVHGIKADPELRCRHPDCARMSDPPFALNAGRLCKSHSGGNVAGSARAAAATTAATAAKQRLHEQARERFRDEGLLTARDLTAMLHLRSQRSVPATMVPAGLQVVRVERIAGADYQLYDERAYRRFRRLWVVGGDGRRKRWEDPASVLSILGGRGLVEREAELRGLSVAEVEMLVARRVDERHRELARHRRGRRERVAPPPHHFAWLAAVADLEDYYERLECAGEIDRCPGLWKICGELAGERFPGASQPAIYKAVKALQIVTN